jgi:hypothetical protein
LLLRRHSLSPHTSSPPASHTAPGITGLWKIFGRHYSIKSEGLVSERM